MNLMRQFFFAEESPRRLALVRICLGIVLFYDAAAHWPYAVELYSTYGPPLPVFIRHEPLPAGNGSPMTTIPKFSGPDSSAMVTLGQAVEPRQEAKPPARQTVTTFHPPIPGPTLAVLLATLQLFVLAAVTVGWHTRTSLWLTFTLTLYLGLLDGSTTFAKYSVLALHFLLLLTLSPCHRIWSLDSLRFPSTAEGMAGAAWTRRLMQLQVCHIYLGSALTKLQNPTFVSGDLLQFSLLDHDWGGRWLGMWLATQPHVVVLASLLVLLIELLFPFLVWVPALRIPMLFAAAMLHLGVWLTLNVGIFSPLMYSCLIVFLTDKDLDWLAPFARRMTRGLASDLRLVFRPRTTSLSDITAAGPGGALTRSHSSWKRIISYVLTAAAVIGLGMAWQVLEDPYGAFGRREMPGLKLLSRADVDQMLTQRLPPYGHYLHHVRLGSRVSGHQAFGNTYQFRHGQRVYVVVQFNQHPKLKLEGLLIDPNGNEVARYTHTVEPNFGYAIDGFELTTPLTPGSYTIILQADGFQVGLRNFELLP